jgi:hypothetical protein
MNIIIINTLFIPSIKSDAIEISLGDDKRAIGGIEFGDLDIVIRFVSENV